MEKGNGSRYRIVLACDGIPTDRVPQAIADIVQEFTHRPWHENVECKWSNGCLLLSAENDFDAQGLALMDEFSDAISACTAADFGYGIRLVSIITPES
jgi:hypothetical protein